MAVNWDVVPESFHYLRQAVESCGETRILPYDPVLQRHVSFVERATKVQLDCLASVCAEVLRRGDLPDIRRWLRSAWNGTEAEKVVSCRIGGILAVIEQLGEKDVPPFCDVLLIADDEDEDEGEDATATIDASLLLPEHLRYLIGPALYFNERYSDDVRASMFHRDASTHEKEWLASIAEQVRISNDWPRILQWLKDTGPKHVDFNWEIETLFNLMDLGDFRFEGESDASMEG